MVGGHRKTGGQQLGWLCWSTALPSAKPAKATARTRGAASPMIAVNSLPSGSWEFPKTKGLRCAEEDNQMERVLASCSSSFVGRSKGLGSRFTGKCSQYPVGSWVAASLLSCAQLGMLALMLKEPTCQCRRHKSAGLIPGLERFPWRREWPWHQLDCSPRLNGCEWLQGALRCGQPPSPHL